MRKNIILFALTVAISLMFNSMLAIAADAEKPEVILNQMIQKNKEVKTLQYTTLMRERIKGKMVDKNSFFKINIKPYKLYVKESFLSIKLEGLFSEGMNNNQMLLCTQGFPWMQMSLDPKGPKVRDNHHHTIYEAGFDYFVKVTDNLMKKNPEKMAKMLSYNNIVTVEGRKCHKISVTIDDFHYTKYTVGKGETLPTIAKKLDVNDYMILEKNPSISDYNDVTAGQVITVPSDYAKKFNLYIDTELMLPVLIEIYDEQGLYGSYVYRDLKVNPAFAWDEFNATFKGYHFR